MKKVHGSLVLLVLFSLFNPSLVAQTLPPALVVEQDGRAVRLGLTELHVNVRIVGAVAETTNTMTFTNPLPQNLEGDFCFPLPEGATISGYALDIVGRMVDGVAVERRTGREVFEQIARRRIDPGLAEWLVGNSFKTRIFPVPAGGSRTIRVEYLSEVIGGRHNPAYHLPLNYRQSLKAFSLRIEVVRRSAPPEVVQGPLKDYKFMESRDSYIAEDRATDVLLDRDLVIALPEFKESHVLVEKAAGGQYYFAIQDFPKIPDLGRAPAPKHIVVLWDASRSRASADHDREMGLLRAYFQSLRHVSTPPILVDLVPFANTLGEPKRLVLSSAEPSSLLEEIRAIQYDGGTRLGAIHPLGDSSPDLYLLFSDGISTFGKEEIPTLDAPVYAFSADPASNHALLHGLATASGGRYFNLAHWDDDKVVLAIGQSPYCFLGAAVEDGEALDVFPRSPQPLDERFILVGRLTTAKAKITLHYGAKGKVIRQRTFHIYNSHVEEGSLLRRLWAQEKLADLMVLAKQNEAKILELGKEFSMVTPYTSLIVLESLGQYLEFGIPPPPSSAVMRTQYDERIGTWKEEEKRSRANDLSDVISMWDALVAEWSREHHVSSNFKYDDKSKAPPKSRTPRKSWNWSSTPQTWNPFAGNLYWINRWRMGGMSGMRGMGGGMGGGMGMGGMGGMGMGGMGGAMGGMGGGMGGMGGASASGGKVDPGPPPVDEPRPQARPDPVKAADDFRSRLPKANQRGQIILQPWDSAAPYLKEFDPDRKADWYTIYLKNAQSYGASPGFYTDCSDFFWRNGEPALALQILSNLAEMRLDDATLLRVMAYRLARMHELDLAIETLEQSLQLRPEEPQSYRDLALMLSERADRRTGIAAKAEDPDAAKQSARADYRRAIDLLVHVVMNRRDARFPEIEVIALEEVNRIIPKARAAGLSKIPLDEKLIKLLDADLRIVMTWDADNTKVSLKITEPSGEPATPEHRETRIGGIVSRDFSAGYGPERYLVHKAMKGIYKIEACDFSAGPNTLPAPVTVQVDAFTNYGRATEQHRSLTVRLQHVGDHITVGKIKFNMQRKPSVSREEEQ